MQKYKRDHRSETVMIQSVDHSRFKALALLSLNEVRSQASAGLPAVPDCCTAAHLTVLRREQQILAAARAIHKAARIRTLRKQGKVEDYETALESHLFGNLRLDGFDDYLPQPA